MDVPVDPLASHAFAQTMFHLEKLGELQHPKVSFSDDFQLFAETHCQDLLGKPGLHENVYGHETVLRIASENEALKSSWSSRETDERTKAENIYQGLKSGKISKAAASHILFWLLVRFPGDSRTTSIEQSVFKGETFKEYFGFGIPKNGSEAKQKFEDFLNLRKEKLQNERDTNHDDTRRRKEGLNDVPANRDLRGPEIVNPIQELTDTEIDPNAVGPVHPSSPAVYSLDELYSVENSPLSEPFGPIDAHDLIDKNGNLNNAYAISNAVKSALTLYDTQGNLNVGRKGSGKTTLLYMSKSKGKISVTINIGVEFGSMVSLLRDQERTNYAETASQSWATVIWNSIAIVAYRHLRKDLSTIDAKDANLIEEYVQSLRSFLSRKLEGKAYSTSEFDVLDYASGDSIDFAAAMIEAAFHSDVQTGSLKSALCTLMTKVNRSVMVLIDTMEFYKVEMSDIASQCLQGLVKSTATIHRENTPVRCKLFFPGELIHQYKTHISPSIHKDFRDTKFLEWRSSELITLAAFRFRDRLSGLTGLSEWHLSEISEGDIRTSQSLFHRFLPATVTNDRGAQSEVLSYVLRHTQMTPRQLLIIMNRLGERYFKIDGNKITLRTEKVSEAEIHSVIGKTSREIYNELFRSYSGIYPDIEKLMMKTLPRLKRVFSDDELYSVYKSQEIATELGMDFEEVKYAFSDIGAVGLVDAQRSNSNSAYGVFSYMSDDRLILSASRQYCVHPIFSSVHHPQDSEYMTVYPAGASIFPS